MALLTDNPISKAHEMNTASDEVARGKLSPIELARELDNLSKAFGLAR